MKPSIINRIWARLILMSVQRAGVKDICIAPGSRSTPLTLEAERLQSLDSSIRLHTHFDERGLGFLALGLAKASDKPVAVIVTSGTAVANLLPAVAESRLTREKLVLLTADRPPELIQCGANQAISQQDIFSEHAEVTSFLPSPTEQISPAWLLSTVSEGLHRQSELGGSYHINCPFPEPLYGEMEDVSSYLEPVRIWLESDEPYLSFMPSREDLSQPLRDWAQLQHQKGVLVVGKASLRERQAIELLAQKLQWPIFCDPQASQGSAFAGFDVWLQNPTCAEVLKQADVIVQFGSRLVSKRLGQFINQFEGNYWLVEKHPGRLDPSHRGGLRINASLADMALALTEITRDAEQARWADALVVASQQYFEQLAAFNGLSDESLSEVSLAADFSHWLSEQSDLFIGNSMAIRLLDMCSQLPEKAVFANRGASGIDGLIATASGVQRERQRPMAMLMGDTSALYDLNSLALLANNPLPFVLIIINNDGGGIFDMLPVPDANKETYYRMPHGVDFSHAAAMFGLNYVCPSSLETARSQCIDAQSTPGTTVIELKTRAGECGKALKALFSEIANAELL
ncbi:2-succinyl-5-enolpyruvyl-6-hydroxy-3-cyclohexene-1-carboxylic-acid synthase [Grimontia sp. NTOU-MAR1]|uniref:2-succinyl-5-enolpyruvyl-6-hydroxy-3- cyclohexene-1-carboxylic-acid synthase n=1 Tax=Grimontia sp. NTOU-MAR1 TaxID=3111011 RepID=UPI002DB7AE87|nr:2-succinyl-5-enolpyruvyl-6-hydroxy-3-cyclohexene-1-carboxylic-acid synthase [Grimontia sp. NTOU-MAR1]WRV97554.1 2-succinyl-5-enolpyruvyl-6-hydroxy-3-cyclohexene-1-carboxylic-acid synthase [Grimontia sp. NTOU-MAR1]